MCFILMSNSRMKEGRYPMMLISPDGASMFWLCSRNSWTMISRMLDHDKSGRVAHQVHGSISISELVWIQFCLPYACCWLFNASKYVIPKNFARVLKLGQGPSGNFWCLCTDPICMAPVEESSRSTMLHVEGHHKACDIDLLAICACYGLGIRRSINSCFSGFSRFLFCGLVLRIAGNWRNVGSTRRQTFAPFLLSIMFMFLFEDQ